MPQLSLLLVSGMELRIPAISSITYRFQIQQHYHYISKNQVYLIYILLIL